MSEGALSTREMPESVATPETPSVTPAGQHALVIGIDDYPYVYANPLLGCRNDARRVAGLLGDRFGFRIELLLDREATREKILQKMDELVNRVETDDRVVFHFSGHGSRIEDRDGHAEESLLPHDSGRGEYPNRDITDQEIYRWLTLLTAKTPYVTLIFDSCHAGGIVRDLGATTRSVEPDRRPEALADKDAFRTTTDTELPSERDFGPSGWLPLSDRYSLIAACRDSERARELKDEETGRQQGVLTYYLTRELARAAGSISYREVFERISAQITTRYQEQSPQLEGAWDREVFGKLHMQSMRFAPVQSRSGRTVVLGAGGAHGLVPGSELEVFSPGTRQVHDAQLLGRVKVGSLQILKTESSLIEEVSPGAIEAGCRAVEVARPAASARLTVRLIGDGRAIDELASRIDRSSVLARIEDLGSSAYTVTLLAERRSVNEASLVPQLGRLAWPTWAVTDRSGRLVMAPKLVASPDSAEQVLQNLEVWARHQALMELEHPDPSHALRGALDIELLRRRPRQAWQPVEPELGGRIVFEEGDSLGLRIQHHYKAPLHLAVLDLGLTGAVQLLYPTRGATRTQAGWRTLDIGMDEAEPLELYVPDELPYPGETFEERQETLLFLATTEEADLSLLANDGVRGILGGATRSDGPAPPPPPGGPLASMIRLAVEGIRDARPMVSLETPQEWTVAARSFWLRRP